MLNSLFNNYISIIKGTFKRRRISRINYWQFAIINGIIGWPIYISFIYTNSNNNQVSSVFGLLYFLFVIIMIPVGISANIARLNDIGKSGWYLLWNLLPFVGPILVFVKYCTKGNQFENKYGPNPLQINNNNSQI